MKQKIAICAALVVTVLAGCADHAPQSNTTAVQPAPQLTPPPVPASATGPAAPKQPVQDTIAPDGTVAEFMGQNTELSDRAINVLTNLSLSATNAAHVEIVGYCNKADGGKRARKIALTRAATVRGELIKLGVPAKKIRVKYVTDEPRNVVVVNLK